MELADRLEIYRSSLVGLEKRWESVWPEALRLCREADRLVFCGTGKSGYVARKLVATAHGLGLQAAYLSPSEALHGDIGMLENGDLLVGLSNSGSGPEWQALLVSERFMRHPLLGLLGRNDGPLGVHAALVLDCGVEREADAWNLSPSASSLVAQVCGECLLYALAEQTGFDAGSFAALHPGGQLGRKLHVRVKDAMHGPDRVARLPKQAKFKEVLVAMTEKPLGAAVVLEGASLIGLITEGDIRRNLLKHDRIEDLTAGDLMQAEPVCIGPEARLMDALEMMENRPSPISVLPVVSAYGWLGIIRLHDVF